MTFSNPKVSVIIPTYNRYYSLSKAIKCAQSQTLKDIEIIVVDDCSTDRTKSVVKVYSQSDKRIKYFRLDSNSGSPVAPRNLGASMAKSDYLAFLDSDDLWEIDKLSIQYKMMLADKTFISYHDLKVNKDNHFYKLWSQMSTCHEGLVFKHLLKKNFIPTSSVMIRRETYKAFGGMNPNYRISHDWDLWLRIAFQDIRIRRLKGSYGTLSLHSGSVITETHKRREECRKIIRTWKKNCDLLYYYKLLSYYYLIEVYDYLPTFIKDFIRR